MFNLILLISLIPLAYSDCDSETAVCTTKLCKVLAEDIMSHVNMDVSPFVDPTGFYCSNYRKNDKFEVLSRGDLVETIQYVLEEDYNGLQRVAAVPKLYRSCARSDKDIQYHQQVEQFIADVGGCPLLNRTWSQTDFNLEKAVGILIAKHGIATLFNLDFHLHGIKIGRHFEDLEALRNKTVFNRLFQTFSAQVIPSDELERSRSELAFFQQGINKVWGQHDDQDWSDEGKNLRSKHNISLFNWTTLLNTISIEAGIPLSKNIIFSESNKGDESVHKMLLDELEAGIPLENSTVISVNYNVLEFSKLKQLIQSTPKRIIANFLIWKLINSYNMDQFFANSQQFENGLDEKRLRSRCLFFVLNNFYDFVDKILTDRMTTTLKKDLQTVQQIAKTAIYNYVDKLDWMDNETKINVHEKINKLNLRIGTDKYFERYPVLTHITGDNFAKEMSLFHLEEFKDRFSKLFKDKVYDYFPMDYPKSDLLVYDSYTLFYPQYVENGPLVSNVATLGSILAHDFLRLILKNANELFTNQSLEKYKALNEMTYDDSNKKIFEAKLEAGLIPELFTAFKENLVQNGKPESSVRLPGALTNYSISTDFLLSYTNFKCITYRPNSSDKVTPLVVKEYAYDMLKRCQCIK